MDSKIKVKIVCDWCDEKTLYERFIRVYQTDKFKLESNIEITLDSEFNYLVIINYSRDYPNFPKENILGVIMEPTWNARTRNLLENRCKHVIYHIPPPNSQYIYYPGILPFHFDYEQGLDLNYYTQTTFDKNKLCSIIVNATKNHPNTNYKQRFEFALKILNTDLNVDVYGYGWDQLGIIDSRIKGPLANKKDGLLDYKYSIAIENCVEQDYFSEKVTDCILTNTIPIYYGCPNINRFFKSPIQLSTLQTLEELNLILLKDKLTFINSDKEYMKTKYNLFIAIEKYITTVSKI